MEYMSHKDRPNGMITALTPKDRRIIEAEKKKALLKEKKVTAKIQEKNTRRNYVVTNVIIDESLVDHSGHLMMVSVNGSTPIALSEVAKQYDFPQVSIYKKLIGIKSLTIDGLDMVVTYMSKTSKFTATNIDGRIYSGSLKDVSKHIEYSEAHTFSMCREDKANKKGWKITREAIKCKE